MNLRHAPIAHAMERSSLGPAGRLVWDFLTLFAQQRHAEANAYLAPGCRMLYPGGAVFTDCTEIPKRAAANYRAVQKVFERFDEHQTPEGTVVYSFGALRGEWPDGEPFEGVRYLDRFLVRDGKIQDKKVWNDLCLAAAARKRG
jgi:hypothetical protein